jgi:UDP-GlcNAc:undecaprenyl-phosphate/decaprenyl-phosphate GlcNAc-1-phosphate transferase
MYYFLLFLISAGFALALTPVIRRFALASGLTEQLDKRKIHSKRVIVRMGGIAIFGAFIAALGFLYLVNRPLFFEASGLIKALVPASILIFLLGIYDDIHGTNAKVKLIVQCAAAVLVLSSGIHVDLVTNPLRSGQSVPTGIWGGIFTVGWIVFITNAVNLIDGLDGLAAGVSAIIALTIFSIASYQHNFAVMILSVALAGSAFGFLRYNFNPAKIFMGDTGSLFLGFMLGCLSIKGAHKSATAVTFLVAVIAMGVPVGDTVLAIIRRALRRKNIFQADKEHIHHRLMQRGLRHKHAVLVLYAISLILGLVAFSFTFVKDRFIGHMLFLTATVMFVIITVFRSRPWVIMPLEEEKPGAVRSPAALEPGDEKDLCVAIVNYNSAGMLVEAVESVYASFERDRLEVIVVDNHSTDSSVENARKRFPFVRYLCNEKNEGFARGCNQAILQSKGKYILLLNPDTRVADNALEDMVSFLDRTPRAGMVGSKILNSDGSLQLSCRSFPTWGNGLYNRYSFFTRLFPGDKRAQSYLLNAWAHDTSRDVDWLSGACVMLRREMLEKIGLLDANFFMYCEDIDLCYRAHQGGWSVIYFPQAVVTHHIACGKKSASIRLIVHHHISMYRFFKKHYIKHRVVVDIGTALGMVFSALLMIGYKKIFCKEL